MNLLGKKFSMYFLTPTAAFHFGCYIVLELENLTTLMNHLGGMELNGG